MLKILMFGMSSYPGGTENYIRNIFFYRDCASRLEIDFITYEQDLAYSDEMADYGYRVIKVPHLKRHPFGYFKAVSKVMKEQRYDAVYNNMLCAANPLPVYFAKRDKTPRIILHAHSNSTVGGTRGLLHKLCKGYCDKAATLRLACSGEAVEWLFNSENKKSPIEIIPNAIDTEKYSFSASYRDEIRAAYGVGESELLLGSIGRFGHEKNNLFMLDILKAVLNKGVTAKLLLVGDGALRGEIEQRIKELSLDDRVILTGTVIDPYKYYSAFDKFLFPSTFEGFGIAALEAQSCGCRCYCSDSLSGELNVTGTVCYLPLSAGAEAWATEILGDNSVISPDLMNGKVKNSAYNIASQRNHVWELIYGE